MRQLKCHPEPSRRDEPKDPVNEVPMNKKIMFFDIDGTLINTGDECFTPDAMDAIRQARENGHLMFINTGRVVANIEPFMFDEAFNGFVCACGTYIIVDGEVVLYKHTDDDVCAMVRSAAEKCRLDIIFESHHGIYCEPDKLYTKGLRDLSIVLEKRSQITFGFPEGVFNFDKFIIWQRPDSDLATFLDTVTPYYDYIDRTGGFGEFVPKGFSKATGIQFILDRFGLPLSAAHAVGDSTNDLPMLDYVPHSIAMGNSNPKSLFERVEYVTADIDEGGIRQALEHYGFI